MDFWKPYFWRIVFTGVGLITAISFLTLGFWRTVVILLCCSVGYVIGMPKDKEVRLPEWIWFWRDR